MHVKTTTLFRGKMKVCLISTFETTGGAAIACKRLLQALRALDVDAKMLVRDKQTHDPDVVSVNDSWMRRKMNLLRFAWERFVIWINNRLSRKNIFAVSIGNTGVNVSRLKEIQEADVIHIHWISQGFLSLSDIEKLIRTGKPVVWTMHDMWACTAICHHALACEKYKSGCYDCYYLGRSFWGDLAANVWRKKLFLQNSNITLVTVSSWLQAKVRASLLTHRLSSVVIPNSLDIAQFNPRPRETARRKFEISSSKKVVLWGAARLNDPIKGPDLLKQALNSLIELQPYLKNEILLVLFGDIKKDDSFLETFPCDYLYLGKLTNNDTLGDLYSMADVTVSSSLYETFGQTLIESMACGTPVVSFNNSGQTDIITHLQNGYLAEYLSVSDFAKGIFWAISEGRKQAIRECCVKTVRDRYAGQVVAKQYVALYKDLLKR